MKKYYEEHKEERKELDKIYREEHKEEIAEYKKEYCKNNPYIYYSSPSVTPSVLLTHLNCSSA